MIPNSKPWQAIVNNNLAATPLLATNSLSVVKKTAALKSVNQGKVVSAKRYSFDDNGGGYLGL